MNEPITTKTTFPTATALVASGENLFKSITGHEMDENQQKISDGITRILDGLIPIAAQRVNFGLDNVLTGTITVLDGAALVVQGARERPHTTPTPAPMP